MINKYNKLNETLLQNVFYTNPRYRLLYIFWKRIVKRDVVIKQVLFVIL